ncbi:MAG: exo-alpha-sialidase, partial [Thermoleophilaceae bacterium]|nr:exo-alpha-sialidase [Thermoleophilaceae bacterium]
SHNSPTLARNPVRAANVVISNRIDTPQFACDLQVSFDGGAKWTQTPIPLPKGEEPKCFAPDAAFAPDGTLYLSFATLKGRGNVPNAVWTVRSTDGGRTLSEPVKAGGGLRFQVRLAVDPANPRRIYLTWVKAADVGFLKFTETGNPIQSIRSDDGGATWRQPVRVSSPARARAVAPVPAVGPKGELYVLYLDLEEDRLDYEGGHQGKGGAPYQGDFRLVLARSRDQGSTWAESVVGDGIKPIHRFVVLFPPYPALAVDRRSGRIYAAFHDARLGDPDVSVWSLPAGPKKKWQGPTRVNDTPRHDGTWQYLPQLAVAPNGRLDVLYYDRRSDRENVMNHVSLQSSFDSGKSFIPSTRLSSQPFDSRIGFGGKNGLPDLGSRLALLPDRQRTLAVWSDTRAGTRASNKQDLSRAVVAFSDPPRLSKAVRYGLRYGGLALVLLGLGVLGWELLESRKRTEHTVAW